MGMKYRDPETGQLKELSLKAADTLPIGTIVDYDGQDVPEGWEEVEEVIMIESLADLSKLKEGENSVKIAAGIDIGSQIIAPNNLRGVLMKHSADPYIGGIVCDWDGSNIFQVIGNNTEFTYCKRIGKDMLTIYNSSTGVGPGTNITVNDTWQNIGKFKFMIVELFYNATNNRTAFTIPFNMLATGKHLMDKKRETNVDASGGSIDGSPKRLHLIPTSFIGNNTIKFDGFDSNYKIVSINIVY